MRPYSIYTPPFDVTSGGIRVMWGLYGWLLAKGQVVHVNARYEDPNFVAIYPEIAKGNPLEADHVVRYILNKPGVMGGVDQHGNFTAGPTAFADTDILYYFSRLFGESPKDNYLFLPILNLHLFKNQKRKRDKAAYFVGKGSNTNIHPFEAVEIDRRFAQDQQALADLLNECEVLYVYDPVTAMTELCRLCGCRVIMVNPVYTKEEFSKYEPGMNGISWGKDEEIELDVEKFTDHYRGMIKRFDTLLDYFIEETQR